jgi:alkylated DNA repair dioxygenase AlkB
LTNRCSIDYGAPVQLLDAPRQRTLFDALPTGVTPLRPERLALDAESWVELQRSWVEGADALLDDAVDALPWQSGRRPMYDRMVDIPRLSAFLPVDALVLPPPVRAMAAALSTFYGVDFHTVGANFYRGGSDSVAWHRDRVGRLRRHPLIAIVSLGGPRRFALRPLGGGTSTGFTLGSGDLLVMGGATQHRWEHTVPKVAAAAPRVSLSFRHGRRSDVELGQAE